MFRKKDNAAERLKMALFQGHQHVVEKLLGEDPDLARANFGLACATYDLEEVRRVLSKNPKAAVKDVGIRRPITHLTFSHYFKMGGSSDDMIAVAKALFEAGADLDDFYPYNGDPNMPLSALYGAVGHANNVVLAKWLLEHGANPNDNESLYHSTELGHHDALKMLLHHGAKPAGTNALPRALDFNDHEAVKLLLDAGADPNEGIEPHPSGEPSWVIPALHQAARRMCDGAMIKILLQAGADPSNKHQGLTPYSMARVFGNDEAAKVLEGFSADTHLDENEKILADAASGVSQAGVFVDPDKLALEYRDIIRSLIHFPEKLPHIKRLVEIGVEWDRPDQMGMTPVQVAGWEGLPETLAYFLKLKPDLSHINGYGGTLLSTIVHGSENSAPQKGQNHVECAKMVLEHGVALPRQAPEFAGVPEMAEFLAKWAKDHPGQVVEHGPV